MPENLAAERNAIIRDAAQWLVKTKPVSTEDAAFRLMGLIWAGVPPSSQTEAIRDLALMQKRDGGWGQLPNYDSDAYSTGEALFALREAGAEMSNIQIQRALKFLLSSQERNGAWRMHTRMVSPAEVSPPYFSTGFPYGKDEFLSYAGTSWAVMGLLSTLSDQPQLASMKPQTLKTPQESQEQWTRVALFGSAQELERLLDEGLKPDTSTPNGTTLLMMVAPDAAKTRIVLARGANAVTRTASGADALTIACGYRGAAASIAALLDAGALAEPPEDTHVRRAPLVLASMTGDLENVRLLLARGAKPSVESLSEAVTFGYAEIVQALIRAGADPMLTERSGINLLHWATITGRSNVIPVLVAARVPINAQDEHGFTPLMYAATLDTGPPETLINLLRAGADTRLRNTDGRTALDLAKRYNRTDAAAVLKGP
jgi:ankyrin repeat protein